MYLSGIDTVTPRKFIDNFHQSVMNAFYWCHLKLTLVFLLHSPKGNISFINPYHRYGLNSHFSKNFIFQFCHKQNTIRRCKFHSNCSPITCFNAFLPNAKILFLRTTSARSHEICFFIWTSNHFLSAERPSLCGIIG